MPEGNARANLAPGHRRYQPLLRKSSGFARDFRLTSLSNGTGAFMIFLRRRFCDPF